MKRNKYILASLFFVVSYSLNACIFFNQGTFDSRASYLFESGNCFLTDSSLVFADAPGEFRELLLPGIDLLNPDSIIYSDYPVNLITGTKTGTIVRSTKKIEALVYFFGETGARLVIKDEGEMPIYLFGTEKIQEFTLHSKRVRNSSVKIKSKTKINVVPSQYTKIQTNKTLGQLQSGVPTDKAVYSSYFGGSDFDLIRDTERDEFGNIYLVGHTMSPDYHVRKAYDDTFNESEYDYSDIFITKLDSTMRRIIFSTFIGTTFSEFGECIALDTANNIVFGGCSKSYDAFPITDDAFQKKHAGNFDGVVGILSASGDSLIYSTLFGGNLDDYVQDIKIDTYGRVTLCGYTKSTEAFPLAPSAVQNSNFGGFDGFIAQFERSMKQFVNSTYIGGSENDFVQNISLDKNLNPVFCGLTFSGNFPKKTNINFMNAGPNKSDLFLLSLNPSSFAIDKSVPIGGSESDEAFSISTGRNGMIHLTGNTKSSDFPVTPDAYSSLFNRGEQGTGLNDAIYLIYNPYDDKLLYSTFLGGSEFDYGMNIYADSIGGVNIAGYTTSPDFPVTATAISKEFNDTNNTSDMFAIRFTDDGKKLAYATYWGGSGSDVAHGIFSSKTGMMYLTGKTESFDFPITTSAYDKILDEKSETDICLVKFRPGINEVYVEYDTVTICRKSEAELNADVISVIDSIAFSWYPDYALNRTDSSSVIAIPDSTTVYTVTAADSTGLLLDATQVTVKVKHTPGTAIIGNRFVYPDSVETYRIKPEPDTYYNWETENCNLLTGETSESIDVRHTARKQGSISVSAQNTLGCGDSSKIDIYSYHNPFSFNLDKSGSISVCKNGAVIIDAGEYDKYYWSDGTRTRFDTVRTTGYVWCHAVDADTIWGYSDTLRVVIDTIPTIPIYGPLKVAQGDTSEYQIMLDTTFIYEWRVENGDIIEGQTTDYVRIAWSSDSLRGKLTIIAENDSGCVDSTIYDIFIGRIDAPKLEVLSEGSAICPGDNAVLNAGEGYLEYYWNTGDTSRIITVDKPMQYWCEVLDVRNQIHYSDTVSVSYKPAPPVPKVYYNEIDKVLICLDLADRYAWYLVREEGDTLMSTEKEFFYTVPGDYYLTVTNEAGCSTSSRDTATVGIFDLPAPETDDTAIEIVPNPSRGVFKIVMPKKIILTDPEIFVFDIKGRLVKQRKISINSTRNYDFDISENAPGIYAILIISREKMLSKKIIVVN